MLGRCIPWAGRDACGMLGLAPPPPTRPIDGRAPPPPARPGEATVTAGNTSVSAATATTGQRNTPLKTRGKHFIAAASPRGHRHPEVTVTQRSPSPRGHRHPEVTVTQRSPSPNRATEVTVTQRSPSPRGHRHPEVTVTQRSPSPNRATEVTNGQDPASRTIPTVVHRADTIYAPRRSLFIAPPAWQEWEFLTHLQPEPAAEPPPRVPVAAGRS